MNNIIYQDRERFESNQEFYQRKSLETQIIQNDLLDKNTKIISEAGSKINSGLIESSKLISDSNRNVTIPLSEYNKEESLKIQLRNEIADLKEELNKQKHLNLDLQKKIEDIYNNKNSDYVVEKNIFRDTTYDFQSIFSLIKNDIEESIDEHNFTSILRRWSPKNFPKMEPFFCKLDFKKDFEQCLSLLSILSQHFSENIGIDKYKTKVVIKNDFKIIDISSYDTINFKKEISESLNKKFLSKQKELKEETDELRKALIDGADIKVKRKAEELTKKYEDECIKKINLANGKFNNQLRLSKTYQESYDDLIAIIKKHNKNRIFGKINYK